MPGGAILFRVRAAGGRRRRLDSVSAVRCDRGPVRDREGPFVGSRTPGGFVQRTLLPELMAPQLDPSLTRASQRGAAHA